jgi:hypothetical protein
VSGWSRDPGGSLPVTEVTGDGAACPRRPPGSTHNVSVNGGPSTAIRYPHTGWDSWSTVTMSVNLAAGNNRIRCSRGSLYAELDCVEVYR